MSEPKRYGWEVNEENDFALVEHPQGQYVDYEDYARLKAEIERLTKAGNNLVYVASEDPVSKPFIKAWFAAKHAAKDGKDVQ